MYKNTLLVLRNVVTIISRKDWIDTADIIEELMEYEKENENYDNA